MPHSLRGVSRIYVPITSEQSPRSLTDASLRWTTATISGSSCPRQLPAPKRAMRCCLMTTSIGGVNPARGDESPPRAGESGDRTGVGATGFLVRFDQGFSSPPHIHNALIAWSSGEGHDDPDAASLWLSADPSGCNLPERSISPPRARSSILPISRSTAAYLEPGSEALTTANVRSCGAVELRLAGRGR